MRAGSNRDTQKDAKRPIFLHLRHTGGELRQATAMRCAKETYRDFASREYIGSLAVLSFVARNYTREAAPYMTSKIAGVLRSKGYFTPSQQGVYAPYGSDERRYDLTERGLVAVNLIEADVDDLSVYGGFVEPFEDREVLAELYEHYQQAQMDEAKKHGAA